MLALDRGILNVVLEASEGQGGWWDKNDLLIPAWWEEASHLGGFKGLSEALPTKYYTTEGF